MSNAVKKRFQDNPEKHPSRLMALNRSIGKRGHISKAQYELYLLIKEKYPETELELPIRTNHSWRYLDIAIPSLKLDIEYNGSYWHNEILDKIREEHLKEIGWKVINIGETNKLIDSLIKIKEESNATRTRTNI